MKEFSAEAGGRYTYVEDVLNLQELALAFISIFDDCDNFIVTGCEVSGTTISSGYVYINKKLRYFSGKTGVSTWPQYIYETNTVESVDYASGGQKIGRYNYGCNIAASAPSSTDAVTGQTPGVIEMRSDNNYGLRLREALFGKYALLKQTVNSSQAVNSPVTFQRAVEIVGALTARSGLSIRNSSTGVSVGSITYDGNALVVRSQVNNGTVYELCIDSSNGFQFKVGGQVVGTFTANGFVSNGSVIGGSGVIGNLGITANGIYNRTTSGNSGVLEINMVGYNGNQGTFRNTVIGNGKGVALMSIIGSTGAFEINGPVTMSTSNKDGIILKSSVVKSNVALQKIVSWKDANNELLAEIGFISNADNTFEIKSYFSDLNIIGISAVNIGPAIKEGGVLLTEKYVTKTYFNTAHTQKADTNNVYSKSESDQRYARLTNGLSQFIAGANTKATLRDHIGAISQSDGDSRYAMLSSCLSDMATNSQKKDAICDNIGAAKASLVQGRLRRIAWTKISGTADLWACQVGNIVCIQGKVNYRNSTTQPVFTLPNNIGSPAHDVVFRGAEKQWSGKIEGGARSFYAIDTSGNDGIYSFSITYMTNQEPSDNYSNY